MARADNPPKEDDDAHYTYEATPFPSEASMFEGKSDRNTNPPHKEDIDGMTFTETLADKIRSRGTFDEEGISIPMKDANNLEGKYPMQPNNEHLQVHLLSSQSCYQVLNFDKVIDFATIDRGANHGLDAGMSMVPIMLSNKYVTIKGMGGMSHHNLRLGDFKSILAVRDPKDDTDII